MTINEYLIRYLGISADLLSGIDASSIKGLKVGVPMWANLYTVYFWASQQKEVNPDLQDRFAKLEASCLLGAVEDFDKCVMSNPDNLEMFSDFFCEQWTSLFEDVGDIYAEGTYVLADGKKAVSYYQKAKLLCPSSFSMVLNGYFDSLIGDVYYNGLGIEADYQKAFEYYLLAEDNASLGDYYSEGKALSPDYFKAIQYYLKELEHFEDEYDMPHRQGAVCDKLVRCYAQIGDFDKVEEYGEKSHVYWQKAKELDGNGD